MNITEIEARAAAATSPVFHLCRLERAHQVWLARPHPLRVRCLPEDGGCDAAPEEPCAIVGEARIRELEAAVLAHRLALIRAVPAWKCEDCQNVVRARTLHSQCPSCGRVGFLYGNVDPQALVDHDAAALAAMGAP